MRRRLLSAAFVVLFSAILAALAPGVRAHEPAVVTTITDCGILLPEVQLLNLPGTLVVTPGGTATLTCTGQLVGYSADATVIITDVDCSLGDGGQVAESRIVVRPTGHVTLVCHNNPGSEPFVPGEGG